MWAKYFITVLLLTSHFNVLLAQVGPRSIKDRITQQRFVITYLRAQESEYLSKHETLRPFSSQSEIDSLMTIVEELWKREAINADAATQRIDSYTYGLIERSKRAEDNNWSECYVWSTYMVPSFLADFEVLQTTPTIDKSSLLWRGNAGNIFSYAQRCDLEDRVWEAFNNAQKETPGIIASYLDSGIYEDEGQAKTLKQTQEYISSLTNYFSIKTAVLNDQLDRALTELTIAFAEESTSLEALVNTGKQLVNQFIEAEEKQRALVTLDLLTRSTLDADLPRDTLAQWYERLDADKGVDRLARIETARKGQILIPTDRTVELTGVYTNILTNETFDLSDAQGKTVFIDFWATWCGPCLEEIPGLKALNSRYEAKEDFVFISVSSDALTGGGTQEEVVEFMKEREIDYMVLYDQSDASLTERLGVSGYPTKFVIAPDGRLLKRPIERAAMSLDVVAEYLESL